MIYTNSDGGSRGNPGEGAIGVIVRDEKKILSSYSSKIGRTTNNIAEYKALIKALQLAKKFTDSDITCFLDSELVVKQMKREYKIKNKNLLELFFYAKRLENKFRKVKYIHVKREDICQQIVDKMLNEKLNEI